MVRTRCTSLHQEKDKLNLSVLYRYGGTAVEVYGNISIDGKGLVRQDKQ